jgi:hypothetical protein
MQSSAATLCRERLERLLEVLDRQGGEVTVRQLFRRFAIFPSEIDEAAQLGWVRIVIRKPPTGRPARVVQLSKTEAAKLPPWRWQMEKPISIRHWKFAMLSVCASVHRGGKLLPFPCHVEAYQTAFPEAKSRNGAHVSCSRLMNHPNVFAARQWFYALMNGEVPNGINPRTPGEIWDILERHGSHRAAYRSYRRRLFCRG